MFQSVNRSLIPNNKSSSPIRRMVSLYPRSELHLGHDFVSASGPENQALTQTSHPIIAWQHLAITTGGWMGDAEQIRHERFSFKSLFSPNGIFESFVRLKIADVLSLMSAISAYQSAILYIKKLGYRTLMRLIRYTKYCTFGANTCTGPGISC